MNVRRGLVSGGALLALVGLMSSPRLLFGSDEHRAKELIQQACVQCHRLEGKPDSRFNLGRQQVSASLARPLVDGKRSASLCERLSVGPQREGGQASRREGGGS